MGDVLFDYLAVVKLVNRVAVRDDNEVLLALFEESRRTLEGFEPVLVENFAFVAVRRKQNEAALLSREIPLLAGAEMVHQRLIVILGYNAHGGNAGVDHVGKSKVNQTVSAAIGNGTL